MSNTEETATDPAEKAFIPQQPTAPPPTDPETINRPKFSVSQSLQQNSRQTWNILPGNDEQ